MTSPTGPSLCRQFFRIQTSPYSRSCFVYTDFRYLIWTYPFIELVSWIFSVSIDGVQNAAGKDNHGWYGGNSRRRDCCAFLVVQGQCVVYCFLRWLCCWLFVCDDCKSAPVLPKATGCSSAMRSLLPASLYHSWHSIQASATHGAAEPGHLFALAIQTCDVNFCFFDFTFEIDHISV